MKTPRSWLRAALGVAALGAGMSLASALSRPTECAFAYLAAFAFLSSTVAGGLALLALMHAVGARWFVALRRMGLTLATPALFLPVLFVPIALTLHVVYPWAGSSLVSAQAIAQARRAQAFGHVWMSPGPFLFRAGLYLFVWLAIAEALCRAGRGQERGRFAWLHRHRAAIGAVALPALALSGTWAAFDWFMSAVPEWNMTSVGLYVLTGGFASALGVLAVLAHFARLHGILPKEVGAAHSSALGRLLFAALCLWAYVAVSQLIIAWSANLPREAAFYVPRGRGAWRYLAALLMFGHFVAPFLLLLSRSWKQRSGFVAGLGAWLVVMHVVDMYWLIEPSAGCAPRALDIGPFLLLGALSLVVGIVRSPSQGAAAIADGELARSLGYESP